MRFAIAKLSIAMPSTVTVRSRSTLYPRRCQSRCTCSIAPYRYTSEEPSPPRAPPSNVSTNATSS